MISGLSSSLFFLFGADLMPFGIVFILYIASIIIAFVISSDIDAGIYNFETKALLKD